MEPQILKLPKRKHATTHVKRPVAHGRRGKDDFDADIIESRRGGETIELEKALERLKL